MWMLHVFTCRRSKGIDYVTQKLNVGGQGSGALDVKTMTFRKTVGEIHHGEGCIHVTLDNKLILFLLKCILIHLYAK